MLRIICCILIGLSFFSCGKKKNVFEISGTIEGAEGEMLYLEKNALDKRTIIDSALITASGDFAIVQLRSPDPEFYRLRFGKNQIHLVIDTTEQIVVTASVDSVLDYQVIGSDANMRMRNLFLLVHQTNDKIQKEIESFEREQKISQDSLYNIMVGIIRNYKEEVKKVIISDPKSPAAYFALFQKLAYNITPFSLADREDLKYYSAVATAWNIYYKESLRAKQLHNLVMYGQETIKKESLNRYMDENAVGYIDINLPDRNGKMRSLTSLNGKIILLDFCSYLQFSPYDIIEYRDLYTKNKDKGFEIYQVSYDKDLPYWEITAEKFPWICVNDSSLTTAIIYNVNRLPTNYLIDREGNIVGRNLSMDAVRRFINK